MPPKRVYVLDSYAILAMLEDRPGADKVSQIIADAKTDKYMSVINLVEVLYIIERRRSQKAAAEVKEAILETEDLKLMPVDLERAAAAAGIKAKGGLSYADCFTVALAKELRGTILTGYPEFSKAESQVKIEWLTE